MLKLIRPSYTSLPLTITPPGEPPAEITIQMKYLDVPERVDYLKNVAKTGKSDMDILDDLVVGWEGIADEKGKAVPFSKEAASKAMKLDYLFFVVRNAVLDELQMEHGRRKN